MVNKQTIVAALPPRNFEEFLVVKDQDADDIMSLMLKKHGVFAKDYDKIYSYFDHGDIWKTSREIWNFLKRNVPYTKESGDFQTVKSPAAVLDANEAVDCKNYSMFIGGVLDAIKRNEGDSWSWNYRFASYNDNPEPGHVFVVVKDKGNEIWIDPVLTHFNQRKEPMFMIDKKPRQIAGLYEISGVDENATSWSITVDKDTAAKNFLLAVHLNLYSLKELLLSDPIVLYTEVKQYCNLNGISFDTLINLLT